MECAKGARDFESGHRDLFAASRDHVKEPTDPSTGPGSWVLGPGFGSGSWVWFWVLGSGFWVLGPGFWVLGPGSWVLGPVLGPAFLALRPVLGPAFEILDLTWQDLRSHCMAWPRVVSLVWARRLLGCFDVGVRRVEDLAAYQLAVQFKLAVYEIVRAHGAAEGDLRYRDQLFDAASSGEANIGKASRALVPASSGDSSGTREPPSSKRRRACRTACIAAISARRSAPMRWHWATARSAPSQPSTAVSAHSRLQNPAPHPAVTADNAVVWRGPRTQHRS
jgi:hypothetical protein